jgi:hypothetical protein
VFCRERKGWFGSSTYDMRLGFAVPARCELSVILGRLRLEVRGDRA